MTGVVFAAADGGEVSTGEQKVVVATADGSGLDARLNGIGAATGDQGIDCVPLNRVQIAAGDGGAIGESPDRISRTPTHRGEIRVHFVGGTGGRAIILKIQAAPARHGGAVGAGPNVIPRGAGDDIDSAGVEGSGFQAQGPEIVDLEFQSPVVRGAKKLAGTATRVARQGPPRAAAQPRRRGSPNQGGAVRPQGENAAGGGVGGGEFRGGDGAVRQSEAAAGGIEAHAIHDQTRATGLQAHAAQSPDGEFVIRQGVEGIELIGGAVTPNKGAGVGRLGECAGGKTEFTEGKVPIAARDGGVTPVGGAVANDIQAATPNGPAATREIDGILQTAGDGGADGGGDNILAAARNSAVGGIGLDVVGPAAADYGVGGILHEVGRAAGDHRSLIVHALGRVENVVARPAANGANGMVDDRVFHPAGDDRFQRILDHNVIAAPDEGTMGIVAQRVVGAGAEKTPGGIGAHAAALPARNGAERGPDRVVSAARDHRAVNPGGHGVDGSAADQVGDRIAEETRRVRFQAQAALAIDPDFHGMVIRGADELTGGDPHVATEQPGATGPAAGGGNRDHAAGALQGDARAGGQIEGVCHPVQRGDGRADGEAVELHRPREQFRMGNGGGADVVGQEGMSGLFGENGGGQGVNPLAREQGGEARTPGRPHGDFQPVVLDAVGIILNAVGGISQGGDVHRQVEVAIDDRGGDDRRVQAQLGAGGGGIEQTEAEFVIAVGGGGSIVQLALQRKGIALGLDGSHHPRQGGEREQGEECN